MSDADKLTAALQAKWHADAVVERIAVRNAADLILAELPTARYLEMDISDQGGDQMTLSAIHLADGTVIDYDDMPDGLDDALWDEVFCYLYDDGRAWKMAALAWPFGEPERHMTGRPCLDLLRAKDIDPDSTPDPDSED